MDEKKEVQTPTPNEGEQIEQVTPPTDSQPPVEEQPAPVDTPATDNTETDKAKEETATPEPAKEMTPEQFEQYNETLRRVSKTAKASIPERYNAFEDAEVKAKVKQQVMAGETPNVKEIAAEVVARHTTQPDPAPAEQKPTQDQSAEILSLKAENALLKAGITRERIEAATKLFIAEGGNLDKVDEFVAKYPEWHKQEESGVVITQAPPLAGKTAPTPTPQPVLNDFEKKVKEARKKAGLE